MWIYKITRFLSTLFIIVILFTGCSNNKSLSTDELNLRNNGKPAPSLDLLDLEGNQVTLAEFTGQKVYVKYWASWCSICLAGLEEFNTLTSEDNDFIVLSIVNPGYNAEMSSEKFTKWFAGLSMENIIVLLDEDGIYAKQFGLIGYPTSYFIGSDGVLVHALAGHHSNKEIKKLFEEIH